mmetsp:Transcript_7700/g.16927  ORF Transcript_7700/g.16927 Transcript_7700/m.16927 type:complete len:529 (-) Transcript_7700:11-1597(-)
MGEAVEFFHQIDVTDPKAIFIRRSAKVKPPLLQSHGWLPGRLQDASISLETFLAGQPSDSSRLAVVPSPELDCTDRFAHKATLGVQSLPATHVRRPQESAPRLSVVFMRWGGQVRVGESSEPEQLETDGGWGGFGCPPSDWYIAGVVDLGILRHAGLGGVAADQTLGPRDVEVLSVFLGSANNMRDLAASSPQLVESLRGKRTCSWWMLWPADWEADWATEGYAGFVQRTHLFETMQACEAAGLRPAFPHPSVLYELITSKKWMANLCQEPRSRLPAAVLVNRNDLRQKGLKAAAKKALADLNAARTNTAFASTGGTSIANGWQEAAPGAQPQSQEVKKGVVKLGWSWEAKHVWFWHSSSQLEACLSQCLYLDGWLGDTVIVQEWVDFDFELRLFFLPPKDWTPATGKLQPRNFEYTTWGPGVRSPGAFKKLTHEGCLKEWEQDAAALESAHAQAIEASQFLIGYLLEKDTCHNKPVAMIRMDFMLKRRGPGLAQVVFGEYCETGACCLQWAEGPPLIWRAVLDYALN